MFFGREIVDHERFIALMYNIFKYIVMVKLSSLLIFKLYIDMFLRPLVEVHTPLQETTKNGFFPK